MSIEHINRFGVPTWVNTLLEPQKSESLCANCGRYENCQIAGELLPAAIKNEVVYLIVQCKQYQSK